MRYTPQQPQCSPEGKRRGVARRFVEGPLWRWRRQWNPGPKPSRSADSFVREFRDGGPRCNWGFMEWVGKLAFRVMVVLSFVSCTARLPAATPVENVPFPVVERFESFGIKDGLPTHKVHCVLHSSDGKL